MTHDRSLLDRLCTNIVGLDGQGDAHLFADFTQWIAAQRELGNVTSKSAVSPAKASKPPREKVRRLTYQEQREWDDMEERIMIAEQVVADRQREVEVAGRGANHVWLQERCRELQAAEDIVERLYERWQELEKKRGVGQS